MYKRQVEEEYIPYFVDYEAKEISSYDLMFDELNKLARGVCPTCGKRFLEEQHVGCN